MAGFGPIFFIGTAFSLLMARFGLADSVGGLMYPQGSDVAYESWTERPSQTETTANTKRI